MVRELLEIYLLQTLTDDVAWYGKKVRVVASADIASFCLQNETTAHSMFKIWVKFSASCTRSFGHDNSVIKLVKRNFPWSFEMRHRFIQNTFTDAWIDT